MLTKHPWRALWTLLLAPMVWGAGTHASHPRTLATAHVTPHAVTLSMTLPANASTGYVWYLEQLSPGLWVPDHHQFLPPTSQLVGAPGRSVWTFHLPPSFRAIPHAFKVRFVQRRGLHQVGGSACFSLLYHPAMQGDLEVHPCTPPAPQHP